MTPRRDPHDGWTPEVQEEVQPGDPWRDPAPEDRTADCGRTDLHRPHVETGTMMGAYYRIDCRGLSDGGES